jgi:hypothetical protein
MRITVRTRLRPPTRALPHCLRPVTCAAAATTTAVTTLAAASLPSQPPLPPPLIAHAPTTAATAAGLPPWYTTDRKKLFQRLRGGALTFPYYVSRTAADAIAGFLTRDPAQRLGAAGRGPAEIRDHPFFRSTDWDALLRQVRLVVLDLYARCIV